MESILFNDTADYKHMRLKHTDGVFTSADIDTHSLPEGFYSYWILGKASGSYDAISLTSHATFMKTGFFITKKELNLGASGLSVLLPDEVTHVKRGFSMEEFFGVKESIDLQISQADTKRRQQSGNGLEAHAVTKAGEGLSDKSPANGLIQSD